MNNPNTIDNAINSFLLHTQTHESPHITASYTQALNLFSKFLGTRDIKVLKEPASEIQPGWGVEFLSFLRENRSIETEHVYSRALIAFYEHVSQNITPLNTDILQQDIQSHRRHKRHKIPNIPMAAITELIQFTRETTFPFQKEPTSRQILRFFRDKSLILLLAETGFKVSEICDLRLKQFDPQHQTIQLPPDFEIFLSSQTNSALKSYLGHRSKLDSKQHLMKTDELPLLARHDKRAGDKVLPISRWTASNIIDEWSMLALTEQTQADLQENDQRITPQSFRHYFVLNMLQQSDDLSATQALARHSDRSTTSRYLKSPILNKENDDSDSQ
jgi:integrase